MKISAESIVLVLGFFFGASGALAQLDLGGRPGPYTDEEAQLMIAVWPTIRGAARYEDVNWATLSPSGAPGSAEAQQLTSRYWETLRSA